MTASAADCARSTSSDEGDTVVTPGSARSKGRGHTIPKVESTMVTRKRLRNAEERADAVHKHMSGETWLQTVLQAAAAPSSPSSGAVSLTGVATLWQSWMKQSIFDPASSVLILSPVDGLQPVAGNVVCPPSKRARVDDSGSAGGAGGSTDPTREPALLAVEPVDADLLAASAAPVDYLPRAPEDILLPLLVDHDQVDAAVAAYAHALLQSTPQLATIRLDFAPAGSSMAPVVVVSPAAASLLGLTSDESGHAQPGIPTTLPRAPSPGAAAVLHPHSLARRAAAIADAWCARRGGYAWRGLLLKRVRSTCPEVGAASDGSGSTLTDAYAYTELHSSTSVSTLPLSAASRSGTSSPCSGKQSLSDDAASDTCEAAVPALVAAEYVELGRWSVRDDGSLRSLTLYFVPVPGSAAQPTDATQLPAGTCAKLGDAAEAFLSHLRSADTADGGQVDDESQSHPFPTLSPAVQAALLSPWPTDTAYLLARCSPALAPFMTGVMGSASPIPDLDANVDDQPPLSRAEAEPTSSADTMAVMRLTGQGFAVTAGHRCWLLSPSLPPSVSSLSRAAASDHLVSMCLANFRDFQQLVAARISSIRQPKGASSVEEDVTVSVPSRWFDTTQDISCSSSAAGPSVRGDAAILLRRCASAVTPVAASALLAGLHVSVAASAIRISFEVSGAQRPTVWASQLSSPRLQQAPTSFPLSSGVHMPRGRGRLLSTASAPSPMLAWSLPSLEQQLPELQVSPREPLASLVSPEPLSGGTTALSSDPMATTSGAFAFLDDDAFLDL